MIPPIHFAAPPRRRKSRLTIPPPIVVSRDTLSQACARALNEPVIVTDIGDGALLVEPLHFHRAFRVAGKVKVSHVHTQPISQKGRHDNV